MLSITDAAVLIVVLSGAFALLCALADYAIPSAILLRRRRRIERKLREAQQPRLAPLMSEEWQ